DRPLDVFRKDVQPFGRDDHFLLAALDIELTLRVDLADVAGVEPAVGKRLGGGLCRTEVPFRHVLALDQNLAIRRDLHVHAGDRLADRPASRAEWMIQAHDRGGFGEAISLNYGE